MAIPQMMNNAKNGEIAVTLYPGHVHGTNMFLDPDIENRVITGILNWLHLHLAG